MSTAKLAMVYPETATIKSLFQDLRILSKSKVVRLMLLTASVGMMFTPTHFWHASSIIGGLIGIAFAAYAAGMLNQILEKDIDRSMQRTAKRPLVQSRISLNSAKRICILYSILSISILALFTNLLTCILTSISMIGYSWFYTQILKPNTSQNIVIGGLFGAMPPLLGWCALTNFISPQPLALVAIIYTWTPPHFWCLALTKIDDYQQAQLPMLPNTHGIQYTKISILCYSVLLIICTQLPFILMMSSIYYWVLANTLNIWILTKLYKVYRSADPKVYMHGFICSNIYLASLFIIMIVDYLCQ